MRNDGLLGCLFRIRCKAIQKYTFAPSPIGHHKSSKQPYKIFLQAKILLLNISLFQTENMFGTGMANVDKR
jgi:hypothetical protein